MADEGERKSIHGKRRHHRSRRHSSRGRHRHKVTEAPAEETKAAAQTASSESSRRRSRKKRKRRKRTNMPSATGRKRRIQAAGVILSILGAGSLVAGAVLPSMHDRHMETPLVMLMLGGGLFLCIVGMLVWGSQSRKP